MPASAAATRARILLAARRELNRRGFAGVTVRSLAAAARISHGNLCYHYRNVAAVVAALVDELAATSDAQIAGVDLSRPPLGMLMELQHATFSLMAHYRFFFVDYVAIVRALPRLRARLQRIKEGRQEQFLLLLSSLRALDLMHPERRRGDDRRLFQQYDLVADFWISQAEIVFGGVSERSQRHYEQLALGLLVPQLTDAGLEQLTSLRDWPAG
jgi:AcrR family transcriptional regulator